MLRRPLTPQEQIQRMKAIMRKRMGEYATSDDFEGTEEQRDRMIRLSNYEKVI